MPRTSKQYKHYRGQKANIASAIATVADAGEILIAWQNATTTSPAELYVVGQDGVIRPVKMDIANLEGTFRITDVKTGTGTPWTQAYPISGWTPDEGDVWIDSSTNPPKHYIFRGGTATTEANWSVITVNPFSPQVKNTVLAGPASGTDAIPVFRAIHTLLAGANNSDCQITIGTDTDGKAIITAVVKTVDAGFW